MNLTQKQIELLLVVDAKNPDGTSTDLDQIIERLSYKPSKESIQFSIRAMINHGLIAKVGQENRRDRKRTIIAPTELGQLFAKANRKKSLAEELLEADDSFSLLT